MPTDYGDLPLSVLGAFEQAYPPSSDPGVAAEIAALEKLFGREMPDELSRVIELDRHEALSPRPVALAAEARPFEALILRAQELDDCVPLMFPLTTSLYLRRFEGWADLLGNLPFAEGCPAMPFVGWRQDAWAVDLPSFLRVAAARTALNEGRDGEIEALLAPVWGRIGPNEHLQELFQFLEDEGIQERLDAAWGDQPRLRERLAQWWRHERGLFHGFALIGKYRHPEQGAFDDDPIPTLEHPQLFRSVGGQLQALCRSWFLESDDLLVRTLAVTAASPSLLVRDAHRLFTELRGGRRTVGTVDLHDARERYRVWVKDEAAYQRHQRTTRRAALEAKLAPSAHGIELVRADWPLAAQAVTASTPPPARATSWNGKTLELVVDGVSRTLPAPPPEAKLSFGSYQPKAALSPSGRKLVVDASQHRKAANGRSWENAPLLVEHDLDAGTWRVLSNAKGGQWFVAIDEDRWVYGDTSTAYLLRDTGETLADATYTATLGQPKAYCLPDLGVVIAYGSPDLANGRRPEDRGAPWVRVIGFWRDRLAEIAAFPIDAIELAAECTDGVWRVGLISADRAVAWELRGLAAGVAAWRADSQAAEAADRAKREAFGEVTIHNAIAALDTFVGTSYGAEIQDGVTAVFDRMLETLRGDAAAVTAAKATAKALDFVTHVKGPFAKGLMEAGLGPRFMDFAVKATIMNPQIADVVVRAATTSAWKALRGD